MQGRPDLIWVSVRPDLIWVSVRPDLIWVSVRPDLIWVSVRGMQGRSTDRVEHSVEHQRGNVGGVGGDLRASSFHGRAPRLLAGQDGHVVPA